MASETGQINATLFGEYSITLIQKTEEGQTFWTQNSDPIPLTKAKVIAKWNSLFPSLKKYQQLIPDDTGLTVEKWDRQTKAEISYANVNGTPLWGRAKNIISLDNIGITTSKEILVLKS